MRPLAQDLPQRTFSVSKTQRHQQAEPKPKPRQIKRRKQWQAMQLPLESYQEPEAPIYKPMG